MSPIYEITTIGGRTNILGKLREFRFDGGSLSISGLSLAEAQQVLEYLAGPSPDSRAGQTLKQWGLPGAGLPVTSHNPPVTAPVTPQGRTRSALSPETVPRSNDKESDEAGDRPATRRGRARKESPAESEGRVVPSRSEEPGAEVMAQAASTMNDVLARARGLGQSLRSTSSAADTATDATDAEEVDVEADAETESVSASDAGFGGAGDTGDEDSEPELETAAPAAAPKPQASTAATAATASRAATRTTAGKTNLVDDANGATETPRSGRPAAAAATQPRRSDKEPSRPAASAPAATATRAAQQPANTNGNGTQPRRESSKSSTSGNWVIDPGAIPPEVYGAKSMRALVQFFVKKGVKNADTIYAECQHIRDQVPMFEKVQDLKTRIEAALEMMLVE